MSNELIDINSYLRMIGLDVSNRNTTWDLTTSKTIKPSLNNTIRAIRALDIGVKRDTFADVILISNLEGSETLENWREGKLRESTLTFIRQKISQDFNFDPGGEKIFDALSSIAEVNCFNPIVDWLETLKWDGQCRLNSWLPMIVACEPNELNHYIGRLMILGLVARALYPGTKFDYCIVLEGHQGCGKSSLVRMLASGPGETYFADTPGLIGMDNKERAELLCGKLLVELAELSGMARRESEEIKAFLTQSSDRYRPAYGRVASDHPRTCIFIGTTNSVTYLSDPSGNRRFLPVKCGNIDLAKFEKIRDQLISEAVHVLNQICKSFVDSGVKVKPGYSLPYRISDEYLTLPTDLRLAAAEIVDERRHVDVMEESIKAILESTILRRHTDPAGFEYIKARDLIDALQDKLKRPVHGQGIGNHMKKLGWKYGHVGPRDKRDRGYTKKA